CVSRSRPGSHSTSTSPLSSPSPGMDMIRLPAAELVLPPCRRPRRRIRSPLRRIMLGRLGPDHRFPHGVAPVPLPVGLAHPVGEGLQPLFDGQRLPVAGQQLGIVCCSVAPVYLFV